MGLLNFSGPIELTYRLFEASVEISKFLSTLVDFQVNRLDDTLSIPQCFGHTTFESKRVLGSQFGWIRHRTEYGLVCSGLVHLSVSDIPCSGDLHGRLSPLKLDYLVWANLDGGLNTARVWWCLVFQFGEDQLLSVSMRATITSKTGHASSQEHRNHSSAIIFRVCVRENMTSLPAK